MEKSKIIDSLKFYFESELTDYAVIITGEWGVGKTHFLTKEVFPFIKQLKLRPIYISLIGLNDDYQLERLIFQKINPFYSSPNKSTVAKEADYIESIVNNSEKTDISVPKNLVLCFDDLERINSGFFESAMGFINVFIEHYKTKCIFLCNEIRIKSKDDFPSYKEIKEKYIRYTYSFSPILIEVLKKRVLSIKNTAHQSYYDESVIVEMFKRGKSYNLRTLFFTISIFEHCLSEFDKLQDSIPHKRDIINLILTYCCFYTIETTKGTSHEFLDKITIARKPDILLPTLDNVINSEQTDEEFSQKNELTSNDDSAKLESIQQSYFSDDSIDFERFASIAELIKGGYLNSEMFKNEIITLSKAFEKKEQTDNEAQLVHILDDVFKFSDNELNQKIDLIIEEVKKGTLNLVGYLKLYQNLVWLESLRVKGVKVDDAVTQSFKEGVEKASQSGELEYIQNLNFQIQWSKDDKSEYAKKYTQFADFVSSVNDSIIVEKGGDKFKDVLTAITENNDKELFKLLSTETGLRFSKKNAKQIYDTLVQAHANTIDEFITALQGRYSNDGSFISQMPKIEEDFIFTLFDLLLENKNLNLETEKSLNEVALMFLKNHIEKLIEYHFLENKRIKNEE